MTAHQQTTIAAINTQAFALMGRLHVILRRHTGRITDIEYMRIDPQYCRHVLGIALQVDLEDMRQICERLHEIYFGPEGLFVRTPLKPPLLERMTAPAHEPAANAALEQPGSSAAAVRAAADGQPDDIDRAYIGRLR